MTILLPSSRSLSTRWRQPGPAPFPRLANELVHLILNFAAASSIETCLALTLVAAWTRELALPHLFSTVLFKSASALSHFRLTRRPPALSPSSSFSPSSTFSTSTAACPQLVQNIWAVCSEFGAAPGPESARAAYDLLALLFECPNLSRLAVADWFLAWLVSYVRHDSPKAAGRALACALQTQGRREWSLTIAGASMEEGVHYSPWMTLPAAMSPVFDMVTRLRLNAERGTKAIPGVLRMFPRLTHLMATLKLDGLQDLARTEADIQLPGSGDLVCLVLAVEDRRLLSDSVFVDWFRGVRKTDSRIYLDFSRGLNAED